VGDTNLAGRPLPFRRREGRLRDGDVHGGQLDLASPCRPSPPNLDHAIHGGAGQE